MITVRIPSDKNFDYKECKELFDTQISDIRPDYTFDDTIRDTLFYSYYDDNNELIGCNFFFMEDDKLFIGAYGKRHRHLDNIKCFKMTLDWFKCDIYAKSVRKPAILLLLRCGFKKISDDIYKYERK